MQILVVFSLLILFFMGKKKETLSQSCSMEWTLKEDDMVVITLLTVQAPVWHIVPPGQTRNWLSFLSLGVVLTSVVVF